MPCIWKAARALIDKSSVGRGCSGAGCWVPGRGLGGTGGGGRPGAVLGHPPDDLAAEEVGVVEPPAEGALDGAGLGGVGANDLGFGGELVGGEAAWGAFRRVDADGAERLSPRYVDAVIAATVRGDPA